MINIPKEHNKTARIATIVVICVMVIIGFLGWAGNKSLTPKLFDHVFGLSNYVLAQISTQISKKVDSGYSVTFIFAPNSINKDAQLLFYAEKEQIVEVTINGNLRGAKAKKLKIFLDNHKWIDGRELPIKIVRGDITDKLKYDEPGANLHILKVVPDELEEDTLIVIECLVLVKNR